MGMGEGVDMAAVAFRAVGRVLLRLPHLANFVLCTIASLAVLRVVWFLVYWY
jgi:hypothetical protein